MPPNGRWKGADVVSQIFEATEEVADNLNTLPIQVRRHIGDLRQASNELRKLIDRIAPLADRLPLERLDFQLVSSADALEFANFFKTLARLQQFLVNLDIEVLRVLCYRGMLPESISDICDAMVTGQSEIRSSLQALCRDLRPDQVPATMLHAADTWRRTWYEGDPLQIGSFLMIDCRDRFLWLCDCLIEFDELVERLSRQAASLPRRPPQY